MSLSLDEVAHIAAYARIDLDAAELASMRDYLDDALAMLDPHLLADAGREEPAPVPDAAPQGDAALCPEPLSTLAPDVPDPGRCLAPDVALGAAVTTEGQSFRIPRMLDDGQGGA